MPILGALDDADEVLERLREQNRLPATLVLVGSDVSGKELEALLDAADRHGVTVRRAPRPTALDPTAPERQRPDGGPLGAERRITLRPIGIEELLDRPQVPLDREGIARLVRGRRVLVTGAGGTIGGELARQVAGLGPAMLTLLDHGEFALYSIDLELGELHPEVPRRAVLADVRDETRIRRLMEEARPELVFHAAALKHVPMVENDPAEGLLTNAQGTRIVADAARAASTMSSAWRPPGPGPPRLLSGAASAAPVASSVSATGPSPSARAAANTPTLRRSVARAPLALRRIGSRPATASGSTHA